MTILPNLDSTNASDFLTNSQYVKKEDLMGGTVEYMIKDTDVVEFGSASKGDLKRLPQLILDGDELFTLNKTNTRTLVDHYGNDMQQWKGRPVVLAYDKYVQYAGRMVGGIRLQIPGPAPDSDVGF